MCGRRGVGGYSVSERDGALSLLGMPEAELSRISKESGLGHVERAGNEKETYFTYEESQRICLFAARQTEAARP
jgi:hypothetical protein